MSFVKCNILVHDRVLNEIGIEDNDWHPFAFEINSVIATKEFTFNEGEKNQRPSSILYFQNCDFVVDIPIQRMMEFVGAVSHDKRHVL